MTRVLSFHYVLTNKKGETIDSSRKGEPFAVLEGAHQIIPGLEAELFKMNTGEKKRIDVPAALAYGAHNETMKIKVPRSKLPAGDFQVGTRFSAGPQGDGPIFIVTAIEGDMVSLDGNHPLAGEDLTFDVEVTDIREATAEETTHGHAHGPEGHHHH
jgi:FKBP-type peptidyl-prolyl cis-trans isomerase SlyD